jgi:hypothetical protein
MIRASWVSSATCIERLSDVARTCVATYRASSGCACDGHPIYGKHFRNLACRWIHDAFSIRAFDEHRIAETKCRSAIRHLITCTRRPSPWACHGHSISDNCSRNLPCSQISVGLCRFRLPLACRPLDTFEKDKKTFHTGDCFIDKNAVITITTSTAIPKSRRFYHPANTTSAV